MGSIELLSQLFQALTPGKQRKYAAAIKFVIKRFRADNSHMFALLRADDLSVFSGLAGRTLGGACFAFTLPEAAVGRRIAVAAREGRS